MLIPTFHIIFGFFLLIGEAAFSIFFMIYFENNLNTAMNISFAIHYFLISFYIYIVIQTNIELRKSLLFFLEKDQII